MTLTSAIGAAVPRPRKRLEWHDRWVGEVLRRARIARGLSQAEAARDFGALKQSFISKVERGARHVHPEELAQFAALYGRTLQSLEHEIASGSTVTGNADRVPRKRVKRRFEQQVLGREYEEVFAADENSHAETGPARGEGDGAEGAVDWRRIENTGRHIIVFPAPLRAHAMPPAIPVLSPADQRRREHLSHLLDLEDAGALRDLSAEWIPVLDAYGRDGSTPLYEAVVRERLAAIDALVDLGADPRRVQCFPWAADAREVTPLNAAARTTRPGRIVELLCQEVTQDSILRDAYASGPIHDAAFLALPNGDHLLEAIWRKFPYG